LIELKFYLSFFSNTFSSVPAVRFKTTPRMAASIDHLLTQNDDLFDYSNSYQLAIRLLLDGYREFLGRQKGKGRADRLTDIDASLEIWEHELRQQAQNLDDHGMAASIAAATASDQFLLLQALDEEVIANSDRQLALLLGQDDTAREDTINDHLKICTVSTSAEISEVIKDLAQLALSNNLSGTSTGSSDSSSLNCVSCLEGLGIEVFTSGCSHTTAETVFMISLSQHLKTRSSIRLDAVAKYLLLG